MNPAELLNSEELKMRRQQTSLILFILFIYIFIYLFIYMGHYQKMEESVSLLIFSHPRPPPCCFSVNNT